MKPTCKKCKFGRWEWQDYGVPGVYHCLACDEWIPEKDGDNEDLPCMGFVPDDDYVHDNATKE